tara:strand:- start:36 stop:341 length:306 start_codon:yes stop_codon:yes gene_type:complete
MRIHKTQYCGRMKKLIQATILLIGSSTLFSGCASMISERGGIFPGASYDLEVMAGKPAKQNWLLSPPQTPSGAAFDLPFSIVLDTVSLPFQIIKTLSGGTK